MTGSDDNAIEPKNEINEAESETEARNTGAFGLEAGVHWVSGGVVARLPLPMLSECGAWSLAGNVKYIQMLADSVEEANDGGTEYELRGRIGIAFSY